MKRDGEEEGEGGLRQRVSTYSRWMGGQTDRSTAESLQTTFMWSAAAGAAYFKPHEFLLESAPTAFEIVERQRVVKLLFSTGTDMLLTFMLVMVSEVPCRE